MMDTKKIILLLLGFSWPVTCIAKIWAKNFNKLHWFIYFNTYDFVNWYAYYICNITSYIMIFYAVWLYMNSSMRRDKDILLLFKANMINQFIDLPHYILFRKEYTLVTFVQGCIIVYVSIKTLINQIQKQ